MFALYYAGSFLLRFDGAFPIFDFQVTKVIPAPFFTLPAMGCHNFGAGAKLSFFNYSSSEFARNDIFKFTTHNNR
jgi:hypothetical protein